MIVAVVGDSISAGSPLWDPDPAVRATIAHPDERSQWQWWAAQREPSLDFRTRAVYGKRTDEIAAFVVDVVEGADVLVVQGGINDVVQGRPVEDAANNLALIVERGRSLGLARRARRRSALAGRRRARCTRHRPSERARARDRRRRSTSVPRHARAPRGLERRRRPSVRRGPPAPRRGGGARSSPDRPLARRTRARRSDRAEARPGDG